MGVSKDAAGRHRRGRLVQGPGSRVVRPSRSAGRTAASSSQRPWRLPIECGSGAERRRRASRHRGFESFAHAALPAFCAKVDLPVAGAVREPEPADRREPAVQRDLVAGIRGATVHAPGAREHASADLRRATGTDRIAHGERVGVQADRALRRVTREAGVEAEDQAARALDDPADDRGRGQHVGVHALRARPGAEIARATGRRRAGRRDEGHRAERVLHQPGKRARIASTTWQKSGGSATGSFARRDVTPASVRSW